LFCGVVCVRTHTARRDGGHEDVLGLHPREGGFEVVDVAAHRLVSPIADRPGAHERDEWRDCTPYHGLAEVLLVVLRESCRFCSKYVEACAGLRGKTGQSLVHVCKEPLLALLPVGRNVNAALNLCADTLRDRTPYPPSIGLRVVRLTVDFRLHHVEQVL